MKSLNLNSTKIFANLIEQLKGNDHIKIDNEPYMPLTIEKIGDNIITPTGTGMLYSLCHYYKENGDLMQDPEMCFIAVDQRDKPEAWADYHVFPYMFRQANIGFYQESILFADGKTHQINKAMQADHTAFANQWLENLQAQGFLNPKP
ncbi:hypothetical protein [Pedobacter sp. MC2016-24]|uniref:DUF6908 domain-containing protein n=1 Tax=Pedobacter sp. MC2016-24 TaxID=2780090 RepID=UPI00188138B1|nr:hypothetical protein [Pedobacter sp. MC2016-24]MBE9598693.1 hypothetical protein [Pedobacter sp. MC2016-24]